MEGEPLTPEGSRWYKGVAARGNYPGLDRVDIAYACKEACRSMSNPSIRDKDKLTRLGKYLKGVSRIVQKFGWQSSDSEENS